MRMETTQGDRRDGVVAQPGYEGGQAERGTKKAADASPGAARRPAHFVFGRADFWTRRHGFSRFAANPQAPLAEG